MILFKEKQLNWQTFKFLLILNEKYGQVRNHKKYY